MGKTISLISLKGGVGKTTLAAALAVNLVNNYGKKVLLVDANYSAPNLGLHMDIISPKKTIHDILTDNSSLSAAIHEKYGVDVMPGNFLYSRKVNPLKLRSKIAQLKKDYDFIVLDSSPSLNDEVLSAMLASDEIFVVTTPDYPTLSCSMKAAKLARQRNTPIAGLIINRIDSPLYELTLEEIQESSGIPVVAKIKEDKNVKKALFERVPMTLYKKNSKFSKEVDRLGSALSGLEEKKSLFGKVFGDLRKERINREVMRETFYTSIFE